MTYFNDSVKIGGSDNDGFSKDYVWVGKNFIELYRVNSIFWYTNKVLFQKKKCNFLTPLVSKDRSGNLIVRTYGCLRTPENFFPNKQVNPYLFI